MTIVQTSHQPERQALILELKDLRINEWLHGTLPGFDFEAFLVELHELCEELILLGQRHSVQHLIVAGLGCCVCPGTADVEMRGSIEEAIEAAVRVLRSFLSTLSVRFAIEVFAVTGRAVNGAGELVVPETGVIRMADASVYARLKRAFWRDRRISFRGCHSQPVRFLTGRQILHWTCDFATHGFMDVPIHSTIHLAPGCG